MELLAGEDNTIITLKEENCIFKFDYKLVYWNSRLQHEHARLVQSFSSKDIAADMFCGIGPFVLPAAKKGCTVYGNDLNPYCYQFLNDNLKLNKVGVSLEFHVQIDKNVYTYNEDARDFITKIAKMNVPITQIIMNLPVSAEMFTDVFTTCFTVWNRKGMIILQNYSHELPMVHCYMFSYAQDAIEDSIQVRESE